jgi:hypothetical protein
MVVAVGPGTVVVTARSVATPSVAGSATVNVQGRVRSVALAPAAPTLTVGATAQLTATIVADPGVSQALGWSTSDPTVATVSVSGIVTGVGPGTAQISAAAEASPSVVGRATVTVAARPVASVTIAPNPATVPAGATVALAATARDAGGAVLTGRHVGWQSAHPAVATVDSTGLVRGVAAGSATITATVDGIPGTATVQVTAAPSPALLFRQVVAGGFHSCGLALAGPAYCWGRGIERQLGTGDVVERDRPTLVAGGQTFVRLTAGLRHSCGLRADGVAFCWGANGAGKLGDGTTVPRAEPTRVAAAPAFVEIAAGGEHTCARTAAGAVYCWGDGGDGKLGTGNNNASTTPALVQGSFQFQQVVLGDSHTCGLTAGGGAVCWGNSQVWNGSRFVDTDVPAPVFGASGLAFVELAAGSAHTCGRTAAGLTYCWGFANGDGRLGDGTDQPRAAPTAVVGAQAFSELTAGGGDTSTPAWTCALAQDGAAFCWGRTSPGSSAAAAARRA